jgi:hypothetical protein
LPDLTPEIGALPNERILESLGRKPEDSSSASLLKTITSQRRIAIELARPRGVYETVTLHQTDLDTLHFENGIRLEIGELAPAFASIGSVCVFAVTIGPDVEAESSKRLASGRLSEGMVLDVLGKLMIDSMLTGILRRLKQQWWEEGLGATQPLLPGICAIDTEQRGKLLQLCRGERIGIGQTAAGLISPQRTAVGFLGLYSLEQSEPAPEPCDFCSLESCPLHH